MYNIYVYYIRWLLDTCGAVGGNDKVKTLRGGNGRRSHDEARPWGGLGFDVKNNTYASESGQMNPDDGTAVVEAAAAAGERGSPRSRRSSTGATPRKGAGADTSPGRAEGGGSLVEKLMRGAWTPKNRNIV